MKSLGFASLSTKNEVALLVMPKAGDYFITDCGGLMRNISATPGVVVEGISRMGEIPPCLG